MDLRPLIQQLPPPFNGIVSTICMVHIQNADIYLLIVCIVLIIAIFVQLKAFARPPPVPLKKLPRRPALQILFKPDDLTTSSTASLTSRPPDSLPSLMSQKIASYPTEMMKSVTSSIFRSKCASGSDSDNQSNPVEGGQKEPPVIVDNLPGSPASYRKRNLSWIGDSSQASAAEFSSDDGNDDASTPAESPFLHFNDLPDSFAPLLSSSQMEILKNQLTADLIHAVHVEGGVRIREGRHELPLDKDNSRPQLVLDVPKSGCRISAVAAVGSDGFSSDQDMDVGTATSSRSRPMVKHMGLVLDPPLPLANVAPTLIHFPTLFEDNFVPTLRRIQIVRLIVDFFVSLSSFIEKILWIIESKCQIHLSKVRVTPIYKGMSTESDHPEWRLSLAFSGHLLLFSWIPVPFISVVLPTFIIPQPHALLEYLLTAQPLASARLKRENIAEERIASAAIDTLEGWNVDLKLVATPPALSMDVTLPGGLTVAVEMMHGRDAGAGRRRTEVETVFPSQAGDTDSLSSWTTVPEGATSSRNLRSRRGGFSTTQTTATTPLTTPFDANELIPWKLEFSAKGAVNPDKISAHVLKCSAKHGDERSPVDQRSQFGTTGSIAFWRAGQSNEKNSSSGTRLVRQNSNGAFELSSALTDTSDLPSVLCMLLFPDENPLSQRRKQLLEYDYAFDVRQDTQIDALSLSLGASHPMLKGGTIVTTILESIYAFGSVTAREGAILDPSEPTRKRNILRHLPAVDFTLGLQNAFIPPESASYSDDGHTKFFPEMEGLRLMLRIIGGIAEDTQQKKKTMDESVSSVAEGIKFIADFAVGSLTINSETAVNEFPELDIFEGAYLNAVLSAVINGKICSYLRPQNLSSSLTTTGPNIFNPLEAYEVEFSGSSVSTKIKEYSGTLGHRRIIIPTETTCDLKIVKSVVDMSAEGTTLCELSWDFQGSSPILQVTSPGKSPAVAAHEDKKQAILLISDLRQGRVQFQVSSIGGITIQKAKTSREDREGLYDWKFFNALVSPDEESPERLLKVLHDKRTMEKLLQVVALINPDLHKISRYALEQAWRAKEIFDQEGVSDPGHVIPGHKMARLVSLFLCGDVSEVDSILPVIRRVVAGEGLDVLKTKDLIRQYVKAYDDWAPEIDRAVRWAAVMFSPMAARQPYVESHVLPLSELPQYALKFQGIPSAKELYEHILDKPELPLDPAFSNLASRVAPYMTFRQAEYFLQVRKSTDWQPRDLRRLRYVYSVKRRVLEISESYGGLSFLPQSFLVSVFLGEATRASLRAENKKVKKKASSQPKHLNSKNSSKNSTLYTLRKKRMSAPKHKANTLDDVTEISDDEFILTPAGRIASQGNFVDNQAGGIPEKLYLDLEPPRPGLGDPQDRKYELGDSLLGPYDVAILLQAGLVSAMKNSTVVQLNQRMLLDLIASQPKSFAVAVLAEIGTPGGQGSPRALTSALIALLELDQSTFVPAHRIDMHALLESWLPGFKIPRRSDYLAGGRWARQSFYDAIFAVSTNILEDAECYMALKGHIQRVRHNKEEDPIPEPREEENRELGIDIDCDVGEKKLSKLEKAVHTAKQKIAEADRVGHHIMEELFRNEKEVEEGDACANAISCYREAFSACAHVLELDRLAFHSEWFSDFYRRNYDALMIKSMLDNVIDNVDSVRRWFSALKRGSLSTAEKYNGLMGIGSQGSVVEDGGTDGVSLLSNPNSMPTPPTVEIDTTHLKDDLFTNPEKYGKQEILDEIIDAIIYESQARYKLRNDPLVRLLIPNPPGEYDFTIVTAMGVITEGKKGLELATAIKRMEEKRGVKTIRADTATARSFAFNAIKIEEAIEAAVKLQKPYGLVGYSQGAANALTAESLLLSGTPLQQQTLTDKHGGLVCRQLLFAATNGSVHGPSTNAKVHRLIVMCEDFFKYQQGYFSRALTSTVLEILNDSMDSAAFQKFMGGAQTFLPDGVKSFWREGQHLAHVPTCSIRGVLEDHTTPESLEMVCNMLTKQSGSSLHDSQVHVYDAVGYPLYTMNRNGHLLKKCYVGDSAIQRTHHWSPLSDEVEFVQTNRDIEHAIFDCAKDRHIFPWVDVNVRFGFIKYAKKEENEDTKFSTIHARALSTSSIQSTPK